MSRAGPGTTTDRRDTGANSLRERLAAKLEADRKEIEALTLSEHRKLAESFLAASKAEFATIESDLRHQTTGLTRTLQGSLGEVLRWPLWTAAGCVVTVMASLGLLWAGTWWLRSDLNELRQQTAAEEATLLQLKAQTGGLRIVTARDGVYVVLPSGTDVTKLYTCGPLQCLKIGG